MLILVIFFLIESPLRTSTLSILSFSQPLAYIVTIISFYVALFGCFLIALKPNIASKSVSKNFHKAVMNFFGVDVIKGKILRCSTVFYNPKIPACVMQTGIFGNEQNNKNKLLLTAFNPQHTA